MRAEPKLSLQDDYTSITLPHLSGIDVGTLAELFPGKRCEEEFGGELGLRKAKAFSAPELARIAVLIKQQLVQAAAEQSPELADAFDKLPLERCHEVAVPYDHGLLLSKRNRALSQAAIREIRQMSAFDYFHEIFGEKFHVCGGESFVEDEIMFRVVRPNRREDVGTLHADDWFWRHFGQACPPGMHRAKFWTLVCGDPQTSGLRLAPRSHQLHATCQVIQQGNKLIFEPNVDWRDIDLHLYVGKVGEPLLFNNETLHVGSLNPGPHTRISFEGTIIFR